MATKSFKSRGGFVEARRQMANGTTDATKQRRRLRQPSGADKIFYFTGGFNHLAITDFFWNLKPRIRATLIIANYRCTWQMPRHMTRQPTKPRYRVKGNALMSLKDRILLRQAKRSNEVNWYVIEARLELTKIGLTALNVVSSSTRHNHIRFTP